MSVQLKNLITAFVIIIFFVPDGVSEIPDNIMNTAARGDTNFGFLKLVRKPRETIVGNGCPKGRFRYYGKCKSLKEIRTSDYDDIDLTNETQTFTPTTTVREDKVETIESDINLSIIPLSRPDITTEPSSDVKTSEIVEKSSLLVTESNPTVTFRTPEGTALKPDVSESSPALTGSSQSEATDPITAVTESGYAKTQFKPTVEIEPKTVMTEDKPILQDTSNRSSTKQISTPEFVNTFTLTDLTPIVVETTTAMTEIVTRVDSTFAILETTPVGTKSKSVTTDVEPILKITSEGGSEVTAYSTFMTMWTETFSNSESRLTSSLTDTGTAFPEGDYITTDLPSKDVSDIIVQNDQMSNILFQVKLFLFILMLVVFCLATSNWIFEQLYVILFRRKVEENSGQYVSKEEESLV